MIRNEQRLRVIIAPDSFKGSSSAAQVAAAVAAGWASTRPGDEVRLFPMADGGEGTLEAFEAAVPGARRMPVAVTGPDDRPVAASWLLLPPDDATPGGTGVVELACTSGITLLDAVRPFEAHTVGFGQSIAAALDHGVSRLLLAVGGARILSDVTSPLLGPFGAAAVFGPQKGADAAAIAELEANLGRLAALLPGDPTAAGGGAAGGTGFGLMAWGATMASGAVEVGEALGLPAAIAAANIVVTGEGRFDAHSAAGKVPADVAGLAATSGTDILLVAGSIDAPPAGFTSAVSLVDLAGGLGAALDDPTRWLTEAGARLAAGYSAAGP